MSTYGRERRIWDQSCLECAEMEADGKPQAVCYVNGGRGHLLPEDRDLASLIHHYIISTYINAGTKWVLNNIG